MKFITNKLLELLVIVVSLPFMIMDPACSQVDSKGRRCTSNKVKGCDRCFSCCITHCENKCKAKKNANNALRELNEELGHHFVIQRQIVFCNKCGYKRQCIIVYSEKKYKNIPTCKDYMVGQIMRS